MAEDSKTSDGMVNKGSTTNKEKPSVREKGVIYIGEKPLLSYVSSIVMDFIDGINEVRILSRGRWNARALDVAEVVKDQMKDRFKVDTSDMKVSSVDMEKDGKKMRRTELEIIVKKSDK